MFQDSNTRPLKINTSKTIVNEDTYHALELDSLFRLFNPQTTLGASVLLENIRRPFTHLKRIQSRQEAVLELGANDALKNKFDDFLHEYSLLEEEINDFFRSSFFDTNSRELQKNARYNLKQIPRLIKELNPESTYLQTQVTALNNFKEQDVFSLVSQPVFKDLTKHKYYGFSEVIKHKKTVFPLPMEAYSRKWGYGVIGFMAFLPLTNLLLLNIDSSDFLPSDLVDLNMGLSFVPMLASGGMSYMIGSLIDDGYYRGIKKRLLNECQDTYRAIGNIDMISSFNELEDHFSFSSIPTVVDGPSHFIRGKNMLNPIQAYDDSTYVPNDLELGMTSKLNILTGPNSAGKTSVSKAAMLNQVLAQIGSPVAAENMQVNIADKIRYQIGENDSIHSDEGGMGTLIVNTKQMFDDATPRTFGVLDDLIEGTSRHEKFDMTEYQLKGLFHKGMTTVYITHDHEIATHFQQNGAGQYLQVGFDGLKPTYELIPGISTHSHAELVADRLEFGKDHIVKSLVDGGYISSPSEFDSIQDK